MTCPNCKTEHFADTSITVYCEECQKKAMEEMRKEREARKK